MLNLTTASKQVIHSPEVEQVCIFDIYYDDAQAPWRITDSDVDMVYGGNIYLAGWPLKMGEIRTNQDGKIQDVSLTVGNIDENRYVQQLVENYDMIGKRVVLRQLLKNIDDPVVMSFKIKGAKARKGGVDFTMSLGFDYFLSVVPHRTMFQRLCRWKFKDARCKYAGGAASCERTWEDCSENKGNTLNFGAFPGLVTTRFFF